MAAGKAVAVANRPARMRCGIFVFIMVLGMRFGIVRCV